MRERIEITDEQREAIRARDGHRCQYPGDHDCSGNLRGAVHHLTPMSWALNVLNWTEEQVNAPENLIYVCQASHDRLIHPDIVHARSRYLQDQKSFSKVFERRKEQMKSQEPYWNLENMYEMSVIATYRTVVSRTRGWSWPKKGEIHVKRSA